MSLPFQSTQDLHDLFITIALVAASQITDDNDGSILDTLAWIYAIGGQELQREMILTFAKTFFNMAQGPDENNGGPDDLQTLAVDHFGDGFARPAGSNAIDVGIFSRATNAAGQIRIPAGTVIETLPDANGNVFQYTTNADVTMTNSGAATDLTVRVAATALVIGSASNAGPGALSQIATALLDPSITVSNVGNATGTDPMNSPDYREYIRNLITGLAGATVAAVTAEAKTVPGVVSATPVQQSMTAIQWNPATNQPIGAFFSIPITVMYIADATGSASPSLIAAVITAIAKVQACGTWIQVASAVGQAINWIASITLNPDGPNFAVLSGDDSLIITAMTGYVNDLPTGTSFIREDADAAVMAQYGPDGTGDLTAFVTSVPTGDVFASPTTKFVAGTVETD